MNDTHRISATIDIPADLVGPLLALQTSYKISEDAIVAAAVNFILQRASEGQISGGLTLLDALEAQAGMDQEIIDRIGRLAQVAERAMNDHAAILTTLKASILEASNEHAVSRG